MQKQKTIKVEATNMDDAKKEAQEKYEAWIQKMKETPCRVCKKILEESEG